MQVNRTPNHVQIVHKAFQGIEDLVLWVSRIVLPIVDEDL